MIDERHSGYPKSAKHPTDLDASKLRNGHFDEKYVLSSRVRTGRSIRGFSLPPACTRAERREVEKVRRKQHKPLWYVNFCWFFYIDCVKGPWGVEGQDGWEVLPSQWDDTARTGTADQCKWSSLQLCVCLSLPHLTAPICVLFLCRITFCLTSLCLPCCWLLGWPETGQMLGASGITISRPSWSGSMRRTTLGSSPCRKEATCRKSSPDSAMDSKRWGFGWTQHRAFD